MSASPNTKRASFVRKLRDVGYARNVAAVIVGLNILAYFIVALVAIMRRGEDPTLGEGLIQLGMGIAVPCFAYFWSTVRLNQTRGTIPKENLLGPWCISLLLIMSVVLLIWFIHMAFFHKVPVQLQADLNNATLERNIEYPFGSASSWASIFFAAGISFILSLDVFNATARQSSSTAT